MQFNFSKLAQVFNFGSSPVESGGVVGIDIGSSSIKVVQLKQAKGGAVLETYGELQLGPYAGIEIGRATSLDETKLATALVDIAREASVSSRDGALSISYTSSFVTVLTLPSESKDQLASVIPVEARKYVPVPIHEVTLDWFVIPDFQAGAQKSQKSPSLRVLLAAIHTKALEKYRAVLKSASFRNSFSEIEVFSTIRSSVLETDNAVVLLDLGAATTKLYVVNDGIVQQTHSVNSGSQDMTLSLAHALEIPVADAEELKRQVGLDGGTSDPRIAQALDLALVRILDESQRVMTAYETRAEVKILKIILTGGGALLKGVLARAQTHFARPVVLADPFSKVEYPAFLEDTLKEAGPSFAVAIGVALRKFTEE